MRNYQLWALGELACIGIGLLVAAAIIAGWGISPFARVPVGLLAGYVTGNALLGVYHTGTDRTTAEERVWPHQRPR